MKEGFFIKHTQNEYDNITSNFHGELHVDREYPFDFKQEKIKDILPENKVDLTKEELTVHKQSLKFNDLNIEDIIVIPTIKNKYTKYDIFEIKIKSNVELNPKEIKLFFSDAIIGKPALITLKPEETEPILANVHSKLTFIIKDREVDNSSDLSHVKSIAIQLKTPIHEFFISDIVFKNNNSDFTIEDMDIKLEEGTAWIKDKLKMENIPSGLNYLIPKAAAFLIWRRQWQSEGHFQDNDSKNYMNYSQELKSEILDSINTFLEKTETNDGKSTINQNLVGWI